ncbi:hypothetical protein [Streptomyces fulvoviolaceus]|uniref:hypothetical protein n=1 Tax=Streptomyces fulvoviolaceus TaxID=285535 RepID=UPI0021BE666E|nr:hypothetical protein [Streptomyces fulvoviolaceus]MCT9084633.1 hypothetical protein [Streptomyces fulvoviolaceus]
MNTSRGRGGAAVALALMAVLTGCGGNGGQDDGSGEGAASSSTSTPSRTGGGGEPTETKQPSSSPSSSTAVPADGSDIDACFDGRCEIALSKPTAIEVDSRFGVGDLRVTKITADSVVLESSGAGTFMKTSLAEGTTGVQNGLGFRLKSLDGGTAVLEFFHS